MDWTLAIERNTGALKRIVATLVGMAGLSTAPTSPSRGEVAPPPGPAVGRPEDRLRGAVGGGDAAHPTPARSLSSGLPKARPGGADPPPEGQGGAFRPTLPRRLHRAILRLLRPAESAVRRLIVIAARGLVVPPSPPRLHKPAPPSIFVRNGRSTGIILPRGVLTKPPRPAPQFISLPLFDPLKRPFRRRRPTPICVPRISYPGPFNTLSPVKIRLPPTPDDRLDATRLALRLQALAAAIDDLPRQAQRLARWRANQTRDKAHNIGGAQGQSTARRFRRISPLRPGRPPGFNRRLDQDMRDMLTDLHGLAHDVLNDTS